MSIIAMILTTGGDGQGVAPPDETNYLTDAGVIITDAGTPITISNV